jgi:Sulfotransferase domain.
VTGWARIAYFLEIFPDALFVFLNREPRSIVSSWIQAGWLDVTSSPESEAWQWGKVPPGYLELWKKFGATSILSAALKIRLDLDDIYENMAQFNNRCYELEYEDLVSEPQRSFQNLVHFCELKWNDKFESIIREMSFYNNTNKWKKYLTEQEGDLIIQFLSQARAISVAANMKANPPK